MTIGILNDRFKLCRQYKKERGAEPKQNPVAHHKHLHEPDLTLYCLTKLIKFLWSTVSKAFFNSSYPHNYFYLTLQSFYSETSRTDVENSFLKPDCQSCVPIFTTQST